jgi:two-component system aerobic respiration control sensor histidine kinase ArcB
MWGNEQKVLSSGCTIRSMALLNSRRSSGMPLEGVASTRSPYPRDLPVPGRTGSQAWASSLRVLVVDDLVVNQILASAQLMKLGVVPYTAGNGLTAVLMYQTLAFDIIFMDLEMPVMDGIAATAHIRDFDLKHPVRSRASVVAYTTSDMSDEVLLRNVGMDDVLRKPCAIEAMASCVERCCSRAKALASERQDALA